MNSTSVSYRKIVIDDLKPVNGLPLLLDIDPGGASPDGWVEAHQDDIRSVLEINGAILIHGLKVAGSSQFGRTLATLFGSDLLEYTYRSTPRTGLRGNIYTASEYPSTQVIPQHNENSYSRTWPKRIGFMCVLPAQSGGETPICDSRLVYKMLPQPIRDKFEAMGIMYVRNYSTLDLPWSVVFQTKDKAVVEAYCKTNDLRYEWLDNDSLRTSQVNAATAVHPDTGEKVWFNQAHLFHVSSLDREIAETLLRSMGEEKLPRNAYYGDGSPIEPDVLEVIRTAYEETKIKFVWQKGDILLMDNMLYAHGREAYTGARQVLVGMACPVGPS